MTSLALFIGINMEGNLPAGELYKKWGAPSAMEIFGGSYWGLITSNFLHTQIWHIAFNLYWLWLFGKKIEFETGKPYYALLLLSAALVSSLSELAFSSQTGIGLSGIGYALFGFLVVKDRTRDPAYAHFLDRKTVGLFLFWLVLCIVMTEFNIWNIGNAAHLGGMLWGMTFAGLAALASRKQWLIGLGLFSLLGSAVFWSPFSTAWLSYQAFKLHYDQDVDGARVLYEKILDRDPGNEFATLNLKTLDIHALEKKASDLHTSKKFDEARVAFEEVLKKDPGNEFAKGNLRNLDIHQMQEKAFALHADKKYNEARMAYFEILRIDPNNQWAKDNAAMLPH